MKKSNFLRTVLSIATAMLISTSVIGQVANNNYTEYDANRTAPTNVDYVTLKAGNTTMGYYALPDPVFHPNYNAGGAWALTAGFVWNWSILPAMTINKPGAANYAEIVFTATGDYAVNVAEESPAAFGGCADATPTVMNVTVIAPPAVTIATADPVSACSDQPAMAVNMTFTEAVPQALAGYSFAINETIENIDAGGTPVGAALVDNDGFLDFPTTGKLKTPALTNAASPYGYSFNTSALTVRNGGRTRYTYTAIKASDAPGAALDGVISAISQKSDFLAAAISTYAFTDNQIVIIVNPAPATGPIYYIPNTFSY